MKKCLTCDERFMGLETQCMKCRREKRALVARPVDEPVIRETVDDAMRRTAMSSEILATEWEIEPGQTCPTCGHRRGLTAAERQRRYRARQKAKTE